MNRKYGVLIVLILAGAAILAWWLFSTGRFEQLASQLGEPPARPASAPTPAPASPPAAEKPVSKTITSAKDAIKDLGDRLGPPPPPRSNDPAPAFDVARVEADGEAVIAGRAVPGAVVELLVDGRVHDRTTADSSGAFVFVPKPLPPGNYDMTLRATAPDGTVTSSKSAVAVALATKDRPVAALPSPKTSAPPPTDKPAPGIAAATPPGGATLDTAKPRDQVATRPEAQQDTKAQSDSKAAELRIETIEPEAGGGLFVSGRAAPGARVRLYMNDGLIAMATASAEGRVSFSIQSGVRPGDYRIRLDQMGTGDGVASRVERAFRAPAIVAAAPPAPAQPQAQAPSQAIVASTQPDQAPTGPLAAVSPIPPAAQSDKPATPSATTSQPPAASPAPTAKDAASAPVQPAETQQVAPQTPPVVAPPVAVPSSQQPSAPAPASPAQAAPRDVAAAPAQENPVRSTKPAAQPASPPVAAAPAVTPPVTAAPAVTAPDTRVASQPSASPSVSAPAQPAPSVRPVVQLPAVSQPSAQLPAASAPAVSPKPNDSMSPRIAGRAADRRDAVIIPKIDTRLVIRGDNLWRISRNKYGLGQRYTHIFRANRDKIRDPDLIYPGQIFVLPQLVQKN